jgi:Uma2 family endonuclease
MSATVEIAKKRRLTGSDYEKLPEGAPYQLIGGELVMTPAPVPYHQIVSRNIGFELLLFVREKDLGEVLHAPIDVFLSDTETYQPDIIFISKERLDIIGEKKIEAAPDLVIEVLSPATAYYDLRYKKHIYEQFGVREYWIVDPIEKSIEVYENSGKEFKLKDKVREKGSITSKFLKDFSINVKKIF